MKKKTAKKLELNRETMRELSREKLDLPQGAGNTVWCTEQCSLIDC